MPSPEMDAVLRNIATICTADVLRAYLHPGKEFGALRPYLCITIVMEPSRMFVISREGRSIRPPNDSAAMNIYATLCGDALGQLREHDPATFRKAVDFISGAGLRDAEVFLASPSR